jgi:arsenate reductase
LRFASENDVSAPDVLFICARNAIRSPMAEALWNARTGGGAVSCGIAPASLPDGHMLAVMAEIGLDLTDFECQGVDAVDHSPARMICLTDEVLETAKALAEGWGATLETWAIPDPALETGPRDIRLAAYRAARDDIADRISAVLGPLSEDKAG